MKVETKVKGLVYDPDRHGNDRYYLRRPGQTKVRIKSAYGSEDFAEEVRCAQLGIPFVKAEKPVVVTPNPSAKAGSLKWLALEYLRRARPRWSDDYFHLKQRVLTEVCDDTSVSSTGAPAGTLSYRGMKLKHVAQLRDARLDYPEAANHRVKQVSAMYEWAIGAGLADHNPAEKCEKFAGGEGFHSWTIPEIYQYLDKHAPGTKAHLAVSILLYTGLRKGDAAKLGRQHIYHDENGEQRFLYRPSKTKKSSGVTIDIPVLPALAEVLATLPQNGMSFLLNDAGETYQPSALGMAFRRWCDAAGLKHCSAHGLRKAGATIAAEGGATGDQIKAVFGWTTSAQADLYTRAASRKTLASQGAKLIKLKQR